MPLPLVLIINNTLFMNHIYTKLLSLVVLAFACAMSAMAQEKAVVIVSADGSQRQEVLDRVDRIEIGRSALTLKSVGGKSETLDYKDIDRILIGAEYDAVKQIAASDEIAVWPTVTSDRINVSGLTEGETISIVDLKGSTVMQAVASEGLSSLSLRSLPAGIYLLSVRNHSVKLIKN